MQWKTADKSEWQRWFAWFPVRAEDGTLVWLETVQRRWDAQCYFDIVHPDDPGDYRGGWTYRTLTPALTTPPAGGQ